MWNCKGPANTYHDKAFRTTSLIDDYSLVPEYVQQSNIENYIDNYEILDHFPICAKFNTDLYRDAQKTYIFSRKWNKADDV